MTKRLYQHFGSKDRLVAEALNDRKRRMMLVATAAPDGADTLSATTGV